ncbi:hypothetical protein FACS1894180_3500 [Bacteroidia bacterium]|nr:hypothetical protein FACS1894180_3500 [Bacteroidia bacterium]
MSINRILHISAVFFTGCNCTIVLEIPVNELDENQIIVSQIHHLTESFADVAIRADYSCMIDANCSEGNDWCDQKRSIAIYFFTEDGGRYQCTGALVNNYQNNFAQYFLTARHCTNKVIDWSTTTFYFNYQNTLCNSEDGNMYNYYQIQGSQLIEYCNISWSDNALLLITDPIPIQANVYYAGVDITNRSMGDKMTCIHHSKGKPKKIVSGKLQHFAGPKWELYWNDGVMAGGGSGAPVFLNSNKRVVATVSGGFPHLDCSNNYRQEWVGKVKSCGDIKDVLFGKSGLTSYSGIDPIKACQSTLNLQGNFYSTHKYDAYLDGLTIQADNTITVSDATFYTDANYTITAETKIVFLPSTIIKAGSNVTAKIHPCSGNLISCSNHRSSDNYSQEYYENDDEQVNIYETIVQDVQYDSYFDFTIYPNPNDGNFTINIVNTEEKRYLMEIFTTSGELLKQLQSQTNCLNINQSDLPDGVYLIKVSIGNDNITKRIVVQR